MAENSRYTSKGEDGIINSDLDWDEIPSEVGEEIQGMAERLFEYEELGTVEQIRQAMEKGKARKVKRYDNGRIYRASCPSCGQLTYAGDYCQHCGQKLDWSE